MQQRILKYGTKLFPVTFEPTAGRDDTPMLKVTFPWSSVPEWTGLKDEIKAMQGARFDFKRKFWVIEDCQRNRFNLDFLDKNVDSPYEKWKMSVTPYDVTLREKLRGYQRECVHEILAKRQFLLAAEMGTGKTLIAISVLDIIHPTNTWYVAPAFALHDIKNQFLPASERNPKGWNCTVWPKFMSYEEMTKQLKNWKPGTRAPDAVIFDESVYVKTPDTLRSTYARALTDGMRADWTNPLILLMSGAPAPKDPGDFWHQLEVLCPGYLREGNLFKFRNRLALIKKESKTVGYYPKLITWWDDPKKCRECGQYERDAEGNLTDDHDNVLGVHFHPFKPSINEVARLYERMDGIVRVLFKKDVLPELPDKVYRTIKIEPDAATKRRLRLVLKGSSTAIEGLTLSRELSDGIRYETIGSETQREICERCAGTKAMTEYDGIEKISLPCTRCDYGDGPTGQQKKEIKNTIYVPTPKDKALRELLTENVEQERIVIYAGFTGTLNRIIALCQKEGWDTIRADGTTSNLPHRCLPSWSTTEHPLDVFQRSVPCKRKIAFVAHPKTAKMGITLTAACMIVYYSNTFDGDDRIQSEDRIHRLGMDTNKGATIVDLIHLDTDQYVLDNLRKKRKLQSVSLGELQRTILKETA